MTIVILVVTVAWPHGTADSYAHFSTLTDCYAAMEILLNNTVFPVSASCLSVASTAPSS